MPCFVVVVETPIERMMKCTSNSKFTMGITTHKIRPWTCTHQARGCNNDRCQFKAALAQLPFPRMQQLTWPETCLKSTSQSHPSKPALRRCRMFLRLSRAPCILQRQPNRPYLSHLRHNKPSQSKHRSFFGWSLECWFETYRVTFKNMAVHSTFQSSVCEFVWAEFRCVDLFFSQPLELVRDFIHHFYTQ